MAHLDDDFHFVPKSRGAVIAAMREEDSFTAAGGAGAGSATQAAEDGAQNSAKDCLRPDEEVAVPVMDMSKSDLASSLAPSFKNNRKCVMAACARGRTVGPSISSADWQDSQMMIRFSSAESARSNKRISAFGLSPGGSPSNDGSGDDFTSLLDKLGQEHNLRISELRDENAALRAEVQRLRTNARHLEQHLPRSVQGTGTGCSSARDGTGSRAVRGTSKTAKYYTESISTALSSMPLGRAPDVSLPDLAVYGSPVYSSGESGPSTPSRQFFNLSQCWLGKVSMRLNKAQLMRLTPKSGGSRLSPDIVQPVEGESYRFVCSPTSPRRMIWDLVGAFLIFYDLVVIPMFVFDMPMHWVMLCMDWISLVFWTLNVAASVVTGYVANGETIMEPLPILINYFKTWFIIDLAMLMPDWVFVVLRARYQHSEPNGASSLVQLMRIMRLMRMTRLARMIKLRQALEGVTDLIMSESVGIFFNIVRMIGLLSVINHLVACTWYFIGTCSEMETTGQTWVQVGGFDTAEWSYKYFTSLHWAITQFTPASMSVQPTNIYERSFSIFVVIFALVGFAYIVGSITGSLTQLRSMHQDHDQEFWKLRRFMSANKVPQELTARIGKYLAHAWKNQHVDLSETDIKLFKFLSKQLYSELQWEIAMPDLTIHPLFAHLMRAGPVSMHRLAHKALMRHRLVQDDPVFMCGETAEVMYFVHKGRMVYSTFDMTSHFSQAGFIEVEPFTCWISEPVLWVQGWRHQGEMKAQEETDLICVLPDTFKEVITSSRAVYGAALHYAKEFVNWLNSSENIWTDVFFAESQTLSKFVLP